MVILLALNKLRLIVISLTNFVQVKIDGQFDNFKQAKINGYFANFK